MREDVREYLDEKFPHGYFICAITSDGKDIGNDYTEVPVIRANNAEKIKNLAFLRICATFNSFLNNPGRFEPLEDFYDEGDVNGRPIRPKPPGT